MRIFKAFCLLTFLVAATAPFACVPVTATPRRLLSTDNIFNDIGHVASQAVHGVETAVDKTGDGLKAAVDTTGDALKTAADKTGDGLKTAAVETAKGVAAAINGDLEFPDNPKRQARVEELATDIQSLVGENAGFVATVKDASANLNSKVASLYAGTSMPGNVAPVSVPFNKVAFEVSTLLVPVFVDSVVTSALTTAAISSLTASGEIGAAALVDLVGLPAMMSAGVTGVGAVVVVGVIIADGAIAGAVKRDQLRTAIHGGIDSRFKLQHSLLINQKLVTSIGAASASVDSMIKAGFAADEVVTAIRKKAQDTIDTIKKEVTDDAVQKALDVRDGQRDSWTNEDH